MDIINHKMHFDFAQCSIPVRHEGLSVVETRSLVRFNLVLLLISCTL
jgi:hypothetical protein